MPLFKIILMSLLMLRNASKRLCWSHEYFKQLASYEAFSLKYEHELFLSCACVHFTNSTNSTKYAKYAPKNLHTELKLNFEQRFHLASDQTSSGWKFKCEHILPHHQFESTSD